MKRTFFITGTDTGVGKTVLTTLLTLALRKRGGYVAAFKPICSGERNDALALHAALGGVLTLEEINPWHFRRPIAPTLAAAREKKQVSLAQTLAHIRATGEKFNITLVEGAGGLLSPLGEKFNSRDLIVALQASPLIVAPNRLGVVNHVLLTREALPKNLRAQAKVVLMAPPKPDAATTSNVNLLAQFLSPGKIFILPWFGAHFSPAAALRKSQVKRTLLELAG